MSDLRLAVRQLAKAPGFTAIAVLTLALGIGSATIVFSLSKALVLDPFPYPHPERIAFVWSNDGQPLSTADYLDLRAKNTSFAEFGIYHPERMNLGVERPEPAYIARCTAGVLRTLGIAPAQGRWLDEADEQSGAAPVVVISHAVWQRTLAGDPAAVGRTLRLDGREHTIVGIMPESFEFVSPWHDGHDREYWLPMTFSARERENRGGHWLLASAGSSLA